MITQTQYPFTSAIPVTGIAALPLLAICLAAVLALGLIYLIARVISNKYKQVNESDNI